MYMYIICISIYIYVYTYMISCCRDHSEASTTCQKYIVLAAGLLQHICRQGPKPKSAHWRPAVPLLAPLGANSATGTRTRVARVRAEYPNQLDYGGVDDSFGGRQNVFSIMQTAGLCILNDLQ